MKKNASLSAASSTQNKFLLNANLSFQSARYLEELGYYARTVGEEGIGSATDIAITHHATKHGFIIVTLDLDFGEIYYFTSGRKVGVIILKLENQTVESVNDRLHTLHQTRILKRPSLRHALVIMDEQKIRIRK